MTYCSSGDTPKVYFQFNNQAQEIYQANVSPIEVSTASVPLNDLGSNYNSQGFQISFPSPQAAFGTITATVVDYETYDGTYGDVLDPRPVKFVRMMGCGQTSYPKNPDGSLAPGTACTGRITVDNTVHCPVGSNNICSITISSNGNTLFQAQGTCPINFQVACGDCPNGYCKIDCEQYPGYCCINEAEIKSLANQLNS